MHRYKIAQTLGEGAFGQVCQATHRESGEKVAIKTLKDKCQNFEAMMALPEVQALRKTSHDNIVKCKELILDRKGHVHLVFELLSGGNLEMLTRKRKEPFTEDQVRSIFYQLLLATGHMHSMQCMHRDIKPENVLVQSISLTGEIRIKLADLGLAKFCDPNNPRPHTTYVSTRWYRSPEILLRISNYSYPSDLWAIGAVMAEVVCLGEPLFPGQDDNDQISRVFALRGHPAMVNWKKGEAALKRRGLQPPKATPSSLRRVVPRASLPVLQLISDLLEMDPARRPSASLALRYPLFMSYHPASDEVFHSRKRPLLGSGDLDTAGTRDYPSSRWSYGTDIEDGAELRTVKTHRFNIENGNYSAIPKPPVHSTVRHPVQSDKLFNIPHFPQDEQPARNVSQGGLGHRLPAGHFDLRI